MIHSRRHFLANAAIAPLAAAPLSTLAQETTTDPGFAGEVLRCFHALPGDKSFRIYAPARNGFSELNIASNGQQQLFIASAIKGYILGEALRQLDSPDIVDKLNTKMLALNDTVWSFGSPTLNPPNLMGEVSERVTLDAMINHSDNTATDMILKLAGAANVRNFVAEVGCKQTLIPDSTRALTAYVFGAKNYKTITWEELQQVVAGPLVHPFLNKVETLASSANDLVLYYSRALQGKYFEHPETLQEYRRILSTCDFIYLVPFPLGVSAYAKSGNADFPGFHVRAIGGAIYAVNRWIYFSFIINWYNEAGEDQQTVDQYFSVINYALTTLRDQTLKQSV